MLERLFEHRAERRRCRRSPARGGRSGDGERSAAPRAGHAGDARHPVEPAVCEGRGAACRKWVPRGSRREWCPHQEDRAVGLCQALSPRRSPIAGEGGGCQSLTTSLRSLRRSILGRNAAVIECVFRARQRTEKHQRRGGAERVALAADQRLCCSVLAE